MPRICRCFQPFQIVVLLLEVFQLVLSPKHILPQLVQTVHVHILAGLLDEPNHRLIRLRSEKRLAIFVKLKCLFLVVRALVFFRALAHRFERMLRLEWILNLPEWILGWDFSWIGRRLFLYEGFDSLLELLSLLFESRLLLNRLQLRHIWAFVHELFVFFEHWQFQQIRSLFSRADLVVLHSQLKFLILPSQSLILFVHLW